MNKTNESQNTTPAGWIEDDGCSDPPIWFEVVTRRQQQIETAIIVAGAIGAFVVLWLKSEGAL